MAPKRRRDNDNKNEDEQGKITWISNEMYEGAHILFQCSSVVYALNSSIDLNNKRQSGRDNLNARLASFNLLPRPVCSIPRPRGEAGRKNATNNAGHRDGFTLKDILKHESGVDPKHYAMIQVCYHPPFPPGLIRPVRTGHRPSAGRSIPRYPSYVEGEPRKRIGCSVY